MLPDDSGVVPNAFSLEWISGALQVHFKCTPGVQFPHVVYPLLAIATFGPLTPPVETGKTSYHA